ncbi:hypothetical protein EYW49_14915 [Siculibacillus lacustris]|uniref:Uncharacterized protein n=1 Tax=Siculibacillus lacustris TaxID=1549641 RepID=A0A4Q9VL09_9HYPH|nr:hypothetical protein [Siculibacillus lacustris]TBW36135.1 hypothetical protein EYW49_14915 [Siculibacillus lacustris]
MRWLGKLTGNGELSCDGTPVGRVAYEFDGYAQGGREISSSGEIRLASLELRQVFGRRGVQLRTDDGRLLGLRFSDKGLRGDLDVAHVDVTGDLPATEKQWRH